MNRREKLIDNYEDALFAVLMDKVAEEEGAKLREENQRLKEDPSAEVPEHVDAVARQTIRKAYASQNRRSALHVARRVLNTVAVLVLICSALFATAYAAFPDVRVQTLNLLIQSSNVASQLVLLKDGYISEEFDAANNTLCGYIIPEMAGFSVVEREEDKHGGWIKLEGSRNEAIRVSISNAKTEYIDVENSDKVENIVIHGYAGLLVEKGERTIIIWSEEDHGYYVMMVSINLNQELVLSFAESIVYLES